MSGGISRAGRLLRVIAVFGWLVLASGLGMAAIFGENNLDDASRGEGRFDVPIPDNCALREKLGYETPAAGRIAKIDRAGFKTYLATGETIIRDDVIISAAHILMRDGRERLQRDERLVFEVLEPAGGRCFLRSYPIIGFKAFTDDPANPVCAHLDVALFRLGGHVRSYRPLDLATPEIVEEFRSGQRLAIKIGFANHPSVDFGRYWSIVSARAYSAKRHDPSCRNPDLFAHDGDSWNGESGASLRIDRKLVGIHLRGYAGEYAEFSTARANIGALLSDGLRADINAYVAALDESGKD